MTNTTKAWWTGTSFAAPWVAGVALLVLSGLTKFLAPYRNGV